MNYLSNILKNKTNCDEQLKIIKDREDYITKQTDIFLLIWNQLLIKMKRKPRDKKSTIEKK